MSWFWSSKREMMKIVGQIQQNGGISAKNLKFQMSIFLFFHFLWIKTVETCRKHASEVGQSLKWVELDDLREKWWK